MQGVWARTYTHTHAKIKWTKKHLRPQYFKLQVTFSESEPREPSALDGIGVSGGGPFVSRHTGR